MTPKKKVHFFSLFCQSYGHDLHFL